MKKLFLSLGAMLVFGIASAQVNQTGNRQDLNANPQLRADPAKQTNALGQPDRNPAGVSQSNSLSNQTPTVAPAMTTAPATTTTTTTTATQGNNGTSRQATGNTTIQANTPGSAGQGGMGSTTGTGTTTTTTTGRPQN